MTHRILALLLLALPFCARGDVPADSPSPDAAATKPVRADLTVAEPQANSTQLFVQNKADVDVMLANCAEVVYLPSGGNVSVTLSMDIGFWVLPFTVGRLRWDCHSTPFDLDLFYFVAGNSTGAELVASIGHGLPEEVVVRPPAGSPEATPPGENRSSIAGGDKLADEQETQRLAERLGGVELSSGARSVRCRTSLCEASPEATTAGADATAPLSLTIMARRASPLSFWCGGYRGYGGWRGGGYGYGWGRPRWGPRYGGGWGGGWGCRGWWC